MEWMGWCDYCTLLQIGAIYRRARLISVRDSKLDVPFWSGRVDSDFTWPFRVLVKTRCETRFTAEQPFQPWLNGKQATGARWGQFVDRSLIPFAFTCKFDTEKWQRRQATKKKMNLTYNLQIGECETSNYAYMNV